MADDKTTDIVLKLRLEMKDLQKDQTKFGKFFEGIKGKIKAAAGQFSSFFKGGTKESKDAIKAAKKYGDTLINSGQKVTKTTKDSNREYEKQKKHLTTFQRFLETKGGRFMAGLAAGSGAGGLFKPVTAQGMGGVIGRMMSRGMGSLMGFATSGFTNAFQTYQQLGQAQGGLIGLGSSAQLRAGRGRGMVGKGRAYGANLGYSAIETAMQAAGIGRATGNIGAVYKAQQFARATGMDMGEVGGYMGTLRQAGEGFGGMVGTKGVLPGGMSSQIGNSGPKQLEKIIAAGMLSGIEKSRLPEYMSGVMSITQAAGGRRAGAVDTTGIAAFMAMMGKTGQAGFQGARGAAVAGQLHQAVMTPGGGEAGQAMMLQALGFGKPGGQTTYYNALKMQQQGLERPENVMAMFKEVYSQRGVVGAGGSDTRNQEANLALSEMTSLSLDQVEKLGDLLNSGDSAEEQMKKIKEQLKKSEPIEKQSLDEMKKGFGGMVKYMASVSDRMATIGGVVAPYMMKLENLQLKLLEKLAEWTPEIVDWIKELYITVRLGVSKFINSSAFDLMFGNRSLQEIENDRGIMSRQYEEVFGFDRSKWTDRTNLRYAKRILGIEQEKLNSLQEKNVGTGLARAMGYGMDYGQGAEQNQQITEAKWKVEAAEGVVGALEDAAKKAAVAKEIQALKNERAIAIASGDTQAIAEEKQERKAAQEERKSQTRLHHAQVEEQKKTNRLLAGQGKRTPSKAAPVLLIPKVEEGGLMGTLTELPKQ